MATNDRYITSNFTPAEPEEFEKWCKEKKINIHKTGYGDNVYLTTNKANLAYDNNLVRFTKCDNRSFRRVMMCRIKFKGNYMMGCYFYNIDDAGITEVGDLAYSHNMHFFLDTIKEQMKQ